MFQSKQKPAEREKRMVNEETTQLKTKKEKNEHNWQKHCFPETRHSCSFLVLCPIHCFPQSVHFHKVNSIHGAPLEHIKHRTLSSSIVL